VSFGSPRRAGAAPEPRGPRPGAGAPASLRTPWRERLRRWLRPPRRLSPTRAGWSFFAITFGVGFAALNTGNNLLYLVLSLMLAFLVLSGVLSESALRGIRVRRQLPRELFARTPANVGLEIANEQRRVPAFALVVEDRVRDAAGAPLRLAGRVFALRVGPGARERRAYRFDAPARGPIFFEGFRVATRFPFGLFSKSLELPAATATLVYPQLETLRPSPPLHGARDRGERRDGRREAGALAAGLRDYRRGDPLRRIHWRASRRRGALPGRNLGRRGALVVRALEDQEQSEIEVRLRTQGRGPGVGFERAVGFAASEVVAWLEAGARVALRTDAERLAPASGPAQRTRLLAFLARVAPGAAEAS
jgi:uncharacterized protein (DUF58 family)